MGKKFRQTTTKAMPSTWRAEESGPIPPRASSSSSFFLEDRVILHGLKAENYNGRSGVVVSVPMESKDGRYGIRVDGSDSLIAVRPENISKEVLQVGDRVVLHNLDTARYNGKQGTVVSVAKPPEQDRRGIRLDGTMSKPIGIRPCNVVRLQDDAPTAASRKSTREQREERDRIKSMMKLSEKESMTADQVGMFNTMVSMFANNEEIQMKMYGRKIEPMPNFRNELLLQGGGIPVGVDGDWAEKYLHHSYEHARSLPQNFEVAMKHEKYKPQICDYLKRLGTHDPTKLKWYSEATPGSIFRERQPGQYSNLLRHSFSNQAYRKEALHQGTTHVAVGFVDLGMLFASHLHDPPSGHSGHLRFIGIEMSAYAVAKTHVVWEMLKQIRHDQLKCVMQVWFSATWGDGTFEAVQAAIAALLSSRGGFHPEVRELLNHWANASPMPLKQARVHLQEATTNSLSAIGHLTRRRDRIALAKYELTRDFGVGNKPLYGNSLMFDCPDGTPPLENDETVFSALGWSDIMEALSGGQGAQSKMNIIEAAEHYALSRISRIASWAQSETVTVELKCTPIQEVVQEIASFRPWTMSWSNVSDYFKYDDFHRIARACSVHGDTVHFGYSMNWVLEVCGTNIIDFSSRDCLEFRENILNCSNDAVKTVYAAVGWDKYLRTPPPTNPINTTSYWGLEHPQFRKWCDYFFEEARKTGPVQVANQEHAIASPLSRTGGSTVAFTWTYDLGIHFNAVQ